uniref:Uncharacterized protein n=1 Tax=Clastoptera arizonana TaxID=38151 RepID=A0A1B6C865_9HEMI
MTALSIFFQEATLPAYSQTAASHFGQVTPCNTPATPPNFPDALLAFSRMSTGDKLSSSPSTGMFSTSPKQLSPQQQAPTQQQIPRNNGVAQNGTSLGVANR